MRVSAAQAARAGGLRFAFYGRVPTEDWQDAAAVADRQDVTVRIYGKEQKVQAASWPGLRHGSFRDAPGQLVLMREPDSEKPYDPGLFTLGTALSPAAVIERYSWRWPCEHECGGWVVTGLVAAVLYEEMEEGLDLRSRLTRRWLQTTRRGLG